MGVLVVQFQGARPPDNQGWVLCKLPRGEVGLGTNAFPLCHLRIKLPHLADFLFISSSLCMTSIILSSNSSDRRHKVLSLIPRSASNFPAAPSSTRLQTQPRRAWRLKSVCKTLTTRHFCDPCFLPLSIPSPTISISSHLPADVLDTDTPSPFLNDPMDTLLAIDSSST